MNYLEEQNPQEESLSRAVGISIGLHLVIIAVFTVRAIFFTPDKIDFSQAIRVDMVGLPDKVQTLPQSTPAKEEPKQQAPPEKAPEPVVAKEEAPKAPPPKLPDKPKDEAINIDKVKSQQKSALDKLKAMAALEKIKEDVAQEKKKSSSASSAPVKGNMLSPGSSLTGLNKLQHDTYAADLNAHIKERWQIPEWLAKRDYKAQARVFIDSRGNILGRKIVSSSGNPSYDEAVLETIDRAAPFPAPPEKFLAIISADGILIGFPE